MSWTKVSIFCKSLQIIMSNFFEDVQSVEGKSLHYSEEYPIISKFISAFPGLRNMRLNGMGEKSGLSPHE